VKPPELEDPDPNPEEQAILDEQQRAVQFCRERLAPRDRELLDLKYYHDRKYQGIATRMNMTSSNVGVALRRARERVLQCLQEHYPDLFGDYGKDT
jgi:RNA polymerase sigma factor (sigma-70 family)